MTEARQKEILELAYEDYKDALEDETFVSPLKAAYNFAVNRITAEVWGDHGIACQDSFGRSDVSREIHWLTQLFRGIVL